MNKLSMAAALVAVFSGSVSAFEIKERPVVYLGTEIGSGSGEENYLVGGEEFSTDVDHDLKRITLGFRSHHDNRFEISYLQNDLSGDEFGDEQITSLNFDAVVTVTDYKIRPFVRVGFGFTSYVDSNEYINDQDADLRGFSLSGGAGVLFEVIPQLELDIGYHYTSIGWEDLYFVDDSGESSTAYDLGNDFSYASAGFRVLFR